MLSQDQVKSLHGATAYDRDGDKIGRIGAVYYDDGTDEPTWVTVHTGLFGLNETFVPVQGAQIIGDRVTLAYDKGQVKDAPNIAQDGHLSPQEEEQLYRHYGIQYGGRTAGFSETGRTHWPTQVASTGTATVATTVATTMSRAAPSGATPPGRPPTAR
jgi:hypothetical protein